MKKTLKGAGALALTVCATLAAAILAPSAAQAHDWPEWPTAITFDGYCDGLSNLKVAQRSGELIFSGKWNLKACGIPSLPFAGLVNENRRFQQDVIGTYDTMNQDQGFVPLIVQIKVDHTWTYHDMMGNLFNSGTWSAGAPQEAQGKPMSASITR